MGALSVRGCSNNVAPYTRSPRRPPGPGPRVGLTSGRNEVHQQTLGGIRRHRSRQRLPPDSLRRSQHLDAAGPWPPSATAQLHRNPQPSCASSTASRTADPRLDPRGSTPQAFCRCPWSNQLADIGETVLIYPSTGGRPKARRMLTETDSLQDQLATIYQLDRWAPRSYVIGAASPETPTWQAKLPPDSMIIGNSS